MITNHIESLNKLGDFFKKSSSLTELDIPELSYVENPIREWWNGLVFLDTNIKKINFRNLEQQPYYIGGNILEEINLDKLKYIEFNEYYINSLSLFPTVFLQNTKLQELNLPKFQGARIPIPSTSISFTDNLAEQTSFWYNYYLRDVSFGEQVHEKNHAVEDMFNGFWFKNNYNLKFLRLHYPYVLSANRPLLGLESTPIGITNGNGYIYVPDNLVNSYKTAEHWGTYSDKIRGLSEYPAAKNEDNDSITKSWDEIIYDCNTNNLDSSVYHIGATKTVEIDGMPTQMVIVGLNTDTYVGSSGLATAPITWMEKTISRFSPLTCAQITSESAIIARQYANAPTIHTYLNELYSKMGIILQEGIKTARKTSHGYNNNGQEGFYTSDEKLWIPSAAELGINTYNGSGNLRRYTYYDIYKPDYKLGETNTRVSSVLIRDYNGNNANYLDTIHYNSLSSDMEVIAAGGQQAYTIFGFCT